MLAQQTSSLNAEIEKAVGLYQAGELTRAANLCQRILTTQPKHFGALHLFGVIQHKAGEYAQAVDLMEQSIKLQPNADSCWCNLGLAHSALGQHEQAINAYRRALALNPLSAAANLNLGMALSALDRDQEAVPFYDRAIQIKPDLPEAHYNLGNALWFLGQLFEAVQCYRRALALKPDFPEACLNLGNTLLDLDEVAQAIEYFRRALKLKADWPVALYSLGNALRDAGQGEEAIGVFKRAVALQPNYIDAHLALGDVLSAGGALAEALAVYQLALDIEPRSSEVFFNMGNVLRALGRPEDAVDAYRQALAITPDLTVIQSHLNSVLSALGQAQESGINDASVEEHEPLHATALSNLGNAALAAGQIEKAIAHFDRALLFKPADVEILHNKSIALLLDGQLAQGWPLYENRPAAQSGASDAYGCPRWQGQDLNGKRILLVKEQGLGNQIQFLRYVPLLAAMGAEVDVLLDPSLQRIAANVPGVARVLDKLPAQPGYDYWSFLMSVPHRLETQFDSVPNKVPYLAAQPDDVAAWGKDIDDFAQGRRRVGLVWAGSNTHSNNRNRSIPLQVLAPLAQVAGIALIVLQQDAIPEALAHVFRNTAVLLAGEQCKDFSDTAAAIMNLDLVISVDTATAHLAGALGRPVWTLLPCNRDWRWLLERDDSPWYPSMRLYRQQEYGQWDEVIARLVQDLSAKS